VTYRDVPSGIFMICKLGGRAYSSWVYGLSPIRGTATAEWSPPIRGTGEQSPPRSWSLFVIWYIWCSRKQKCNM